MIILDRPEHKFYILLEGRIEFGVKSHKSHMHVKVKEMNPG